MKKVLFSKLNLFTAEEVSGKINGEAVYRDMLYYQYWIYRGAYWDMGYWIFLIIIPLVGTFGFIGNLISILVLRRPEMKSTFNLSLAVLVVVDILFVINVMFVHSLTPLNPGSGRGWLSRWGALSAPPLQSQ